MLCDCYKFLDMTVHTLCIPYSSMIALPLIEVLPSSLSPTQQKGYLNEFLVVPRNQTPKLLIVWIILETSTPCSFASSRYLRPMKKAWWIRCSLLGISFLMQAINMSISFRPKLSGHRFKIWHVVLETATWKTGLSFFSLFRVLLQP